MNDVDIGDLERHFELKLEAVDLAIQLIDDGDLKVGAVWPDQRHT